MLIILMKELLLIWLDVIMTWWSHKGKKYPHQLRHLLMYLQVR